jgi:hypothetical protein
VRRSAPQLWLSPWLSKIDRRILNLYLRHATHCVRWARLDDCGSENLPRDVQVPETPNKNRSNLTIIGHGGWGARKSWGPGAVVKKQRKGKGELSQISAVCVFYSARHSPIGFAVRSPLCGRLRPLRLAAGARWRCCCCWLLPSAAVERRRTTCVHRSPACTAPRLRPVCVMCAARQQRRCGVRAAGGGGAYA